MGFEKDTSRSIVDGASPRSPLDGVVPMTTGGKDARSTSLPTETGVVVSVAGEPVSSSLQDDDPSSQVLHPTSQVSARSVVISPP